MAAIENASPASHVETQRNPSVRLPSVFSRVQRPTRARVRKQFGREIKAVKHEKRFFPARSGAFNFHSTAGELATACYTHCHEAFAWLP